MTRLILIRHAKSSWGDPGADDHDRVLNKRGKRDAPLIGAWLTDHDYRPDVMLVSTAKRTMETAELITSALPAPPEVFFDRRLYLAAPDTMLEVINARNESTIAVVSHNPGIAILAHHLVANAPDHPRFADYPTAATTVIDFEGPIAPNQGLCRAFTTPHGL